MFRARCAKANMLPEGNRLLAVAQHFAEVKLKREEFILLKATVLMNAGTFCLLSFVVQL